ncbi:hypothetical protein Baya_7887 [Bagarius yarrelli]|uniref:Uncharacterized protein n=1 Tax=Bagarius yarrelli TaxID=175774 RepID=A0A556U2L2_BAGYA|nr:hypothetical protein Baya_7887 [Bagarius yarrelli]
MEAAFKVMEVVLEFVFKVLELVVKVMIKVLNVELEIVFKVLELWWSVFKRIVFKVMEVVLEFVFKVLELVVKVMIKVLNVELEIVFKLSSFPSDVEAMSVEGRVESRPVQEEIVEVITMAAKKQDVRLQSKQDERLLNEDPSGRTARSLSLTGEKLIAGKTAAQWHQSFFCVTRKIKWDIRSSYRYYCTFPVVVAFRRYVQKDAVGSDWSETPVNITSSGVKEVTGGLRLLRLLN